MALTDQQIRAIRPGDKGRKITDAGGLYLWVSPAGSKTFRFDYAHGGKRRTMTLGTYPKVSLAMARALRADARDKLAAGIDPGSAADGPAAGDTFEVIGRNWLAAQVVNWVPAHALRVSNRLEDDVFPEIGAKCIRDITPPEITALLRKVEDRGAIDVARRIRQTIGAIFQYAIADSKATVDPSASVVKALKPKPKRQRNPFLRDVEVPKFLKTMSAYPGDPVTRLGLRFLLLTMVRTKEARFARKSEFEGDVWRIPAERMKMGLEHLVPISPQARAVVEELKGLNNSEWLLPGAYHGKPISENTLIVALYRMGYKGKLTVHGLRTTASTILNESDQFRFDAIERQLAHVPKDEVREAYNAAQYMNERKRMMAWWGDWIETAERGRAKTDLSDLLFSPPPTDLTDLLGQQLLV